MDVVARLKEVLSFSGMSIRAFAIQCGISQKTLDNQIKGLRGVSLETIISVLSTFPNISAEWMMRGEGDMFRAEAQDINTDRLMKLVDTIATLQDTINAQSATISMLQERNKQLENQLKNKN